MIFFSLKNLFKKNREHLTKDKSAEEVAAKFIANKYKFKVLSKNFRTKIGEVDLIAEDTKNKILHFIEVKLSNYQDIDLIASKVKYTKIKKYEKIAHIFKNINKSYTKYGINIDLSLIDKNTGEVYYFENITS